MRKGYEKEREEDEDEEEKRGRKEETGGVKRRKMFHFEFDID